MKYKINTLILFLIMLANLLAFYFGENRIIGYINLFVAFVTFIEILIINEIWKVVK